MEIVLLKAFQLILCFAILILLHEGGHFLFAKLFKVKVEKFCLFFDPIKSWKLFSYKGTDYHIGWLPLGGYVKISGMIDESMDTEAMKQPMKPWEFRAKPAWQRLLIMIGGVLVNFIFALILYSMILFTWGEKYTPIEQMSHGFRFNTEAQRLGFQDGDILIKVDGNEIRKFNGNVMRDLSLSKEATVLRDGAESTIQLPGDLNLLEMMQSQPPFISILYPPVVDSVCIETPADKAGIQKGDKILSINGQSIPSWTDYDLYVSDRVNTIEHYKEMKDIKTADSLNQFTFIVERYGQTTIDTLHLQLGENNLFGFIKKNLAADYPQSTQNYTLFESIPAGIKHGWGVLSGYVSDLKYVFTAEGAKSVGSFGTIGSLFPEEWDWQRFWELTAFISVILAVMNILPIPALDGGHVIFLLYEVITRRKPSEKFMEYTQVAGMWLLLALMIFAIYNDVVRFLF